MYRFQPAAPEQWDKAQICDVFNKDEFSSIPLENSPVKPYDEADNLYVFSDLIDIFNFPYTTELLSCLTLVLF